MTELQRLGIIIKNFREDKQESQADFAQRLGTNRSLLAHLEQGIRQPKKEILEKICLDLKIPNIFFESLIDEQSLLRKDFENIICELVGDNFSLDNLSNTEKEEANRHIENLFSSNCSIEQTFDNFNRCLIFYGIKKVKKYFFEYYLSEQSFKEIEEFKKSVKKYQKDAIRVFSTYKLAYEELNKNLEIFKLYLKAISENDLSSYYTRNKWNCINEIDNKDLAYLGYIAAEKVKKESLERTELVNFLDELINKFKDKKTITTTDINIHYNIKKINKMDTYLRKFNSKLEHTFKSNLFDIDIDIIKDEKEKLAPKEDNELEVMKLMQDKAFSNLTNYLTADYMDLYIATSMRNDGDFISVNNFIKDLMKHTLIEPLNLRYFNPTQSWIDDRVSKGLVEALMLKRADLTIYMAQKSDTFGKDSEASVSLGQGKPVIVYVPKLEIEKISFDSEKLSSLSKKELMNIIGNNDDDLDDNLDEEALLSTYMNNVLKSLNHNDMIKTIIKYWAEFDLEAESKRISNNQQRIEYRDFISKIKKSKIDELTMSDELFQNCVNILIATTMGYEKRARIFKEVHPLALQVILSSGVLNGILVSRSLDSCAKLLLNLLQNSLELELELDENSYKLIEKTTGSVIRVISKNILLSHAFEQFYKYNEENNYE